jgi:Polyketide synthase dehydratase
LKIRIDPEQDTFLLDHVVDGAPLLPTVMQLDLVARGLTATTAARQTAPSSAGVLLRGIQVGPPVQFTVPGPYHLDLLGEPGPASRHWRSAKGFELRSAMSDAPHLTAHAKHVNAPGRWLLAASGWAGDLPGGPDLVYPPFFHGPAFQVVGAFGRTGDGRLAARLAPGLPPLRWGCGPTVLRPRLLELLLQCCGIQELADTGRMMVPAAIESVHWHPESLAAEAETSAVAVVRPRPGPRPRQGRIFDGQVVTTSGTVLLTATGYQVTDLGGPADLRHAARLTKRLASQPEPAARGWAGTAIPKGAQR